MKCEFNGDLKSFQELEGYLAVLEETFPDCNDFKKLLLKIHPDKVKGNYGCVITSVNGYLNYLKEKGDTNTSFKHFKDLSNEVILNPINGTSPIDTGIFTNPIKTASFMKFCNVNDIKNTFGLDYHNMNINDGKTDMFPTYRKFLSDYPFLNEIEGPIKYKLHLYYLLYGYMKQYCLFDYVLCYSHHLNEYYTNPNYLVGPQKNKNSKTRKLTRKSNSKSRKSFKGGAVQSSAAAGQVPGQPSGFSPIPGLALSAGQIAARQVKGLTHTDRDAIERRDPLYIYIVNSPLYSSLSLTSLIVAGSLMFGTVASIASPYMGELLSTAGTLKNSAEMIVKELPNEFDLIDLSKRGVLATSSKIGAGLGAAVSAFFIGSGRSGVFEDPRIVALPRISSGYLSGVFDIFRWRPSQLRKVKTKNMNFTKNAANMTLKASSGVYSQARTDRLRAELGKFHLFIINDKFITDKSVQDFRKIFKEYVFSSMCLQFEQRVNDLVFLEQMDVISGKRNDLQYESFEHFAFQRPPATGLGAEVGPEIARGRVDPVLNVPLGELTPAESFAANQKIAQSLGIDSLPKWQAMDHEALSNAQQQAMKTIKLSPEETQQIYHSCRQKVSEIIIKTGEQYLQDEIRKGERGVEFYEECNQVLDLKNHDAELRTAVKSVASSVSIIEQNMNLVLPKKVTVPMSSFFLVMASAWSSVDMWTGVTPYSRVTDFWNVIQILMSMRTLALFFNLNSIVTIREAKVDFEPKNAPKANVPEPIPNALPEIPDIKDNLRELITSKTKANSIVSKTKALLNIAKSAVEENREKVIDAGNDEKILKIALQSMKESKEAFENAEKAVEEAAANAKSIADEMAALTAKVADATAKRAEEIARRAANEVSKKMKADARQAAYQARKIAEETAQSAKKSTPEDERVLTKRYKELLKVISYFNKGKKLDEIPELLQTGKSEIKERHKALWESGGEFFDQYTPAEMKEESEYRLVLERWIIAHKKGKPGRVRLWLNKRYEKCSVVQEATRKVVEAAQAVKNAADAARKAKEKAEKGTGGLYGRLKNVASTASNTLGSVASAATLKFPTIDRCNEWPGAETYYKWYFSIISFLMYTITNRKFYEIGGRYLTQNAYKEIMDAGLQVLQVIGFLAYHGRTATSSITLGLSLKSMFTTYSNFSSEMTAKAAEIETGLRPFKFDRMGVNWQMARNAPNGGELFRRHAERMEKLSQQKNRLQDGISKAIGDIRAKAEDARKAYESQQKDYVVKLKEIEAARENARVVMEQKTLEARQTELELSKKKYELQSQSVGIQQRQEERSERQEESSKEIEKIREQLNKERAEHASALNDLNQRQEQLLALQNGEGRQLCEMDRQLQTLSEGGSAIERGEDVRAATILSGLNVPRIEDANELQQRRNALNSLPNAPRGDPRIAANAGSSSGRQAISLGQGNDIARQKREVQRREAAKIEEEKRAKESEERAKKALSALSSSNSTQSYASAPLAPVRPVFPDVVKPSRPRNLGPAPPPITEANFQKSLNSELKLTKEEQNFLNMDSTIPMEDEEVRLREVLLKSTGDPMWRWDFMNEKYEEYIARTDEAMGYSDKPSLTPAQKRNEEILRKLNEEILRKLNAENFSAFEEFVLKPPQKPSIKEVLDSLPAEERPGALKKYVEHLEKNPKSQPANVLQPANVPLSPRSLMRQSRLRLPQSKRANGQNNNPKNGSKKGKK